MLKSSVGIKCLVNQRDDVRVISSIASHADVLRDSSRVSAPRTSADLSGKNVDQSQQTSRSGKCTLDLEKFRAWLYSSRKGKEGLMKGEDLTVLEQTTQLTHKCSYQRLPWQSHWKIRPRRLNLLNRSRLYYKTICMKKILLFIQSYKVTPAIASPKEQLYEQMASNPAFTERNIQKANAYLSYSRQEQKSLVTYHTQYRACTHVFGLSTLWLQQHRLDLR